MAEILGNKLKINSIDIIPSTINHNDEYLKVSSDETKYEYVSNEEIKNELDISGTTLNNWIKQGLEVYQSPFESSKKQYFRVSDVIKFLTVY